MTSTLVVGATGNTGGRTTTQLIAAGQHVKAASRQATPIRGATPVRFDWYIPDSYGEALAGADRMFLVPPVGNPDPISVMLPFLQQAQDFGVRRAVLLSSSAIPEGGPATGKVHQALPGLFEEWAVLRPSWFMQNFTGNHAHAATIRENGIIFSATGSGRVGFVDAEDISAVAAQALIDVDAPNTDLILTGPEPLSYDDVASVVTEISGSPVTHNPLSYEEMCDYHAAHMPREFAEMLTGMDKLIAGGAEDRTTDTVRQITGSMPRNLRDVLQRELGGRLGWASGNRLSS